MMNDLEDSVSARSDDNEMFVISGVDSALGNLFLTEYAKEEKNKCVGLSRRGNSTSVENAVIKNNVDLLKKEIVQKTITDLKDVFASVSKVTIVHPVGNFKFEDDLGGEFDKDIIDSNYATLTNLVDCIIGKVRSDFLNINELNICAFSSTSIAHYSPALPLYWRSYAEGKGIAKSYMASLSAGEQHLKMIQDDAVTDLRERPLDISTMLVNLSTVDTGNENCLRPNAGKKYWLSSSEVVGPTMSAVAELGTYENSEIDIVKMKPGFDPKEYFGNNFELLKKWKVEMGDIK